MNKIKEIISYANLLIDVKQAKHNSPSIESELESLIKELCHLHKSNFRNFLRRVFRVDYTDQLKSLFRKIICMEKSTGAFGFYDMLSQSNLPYAEELLVYGIDHEPYYNNNDMVFTLYLRRVSKNTVIEKHIESLFNPEELLRGHFFYYKNVIFEMNKLRMSLPSVSTPKHIEMEVIHSIRSGTFGQRKSKATAVAILLNLKSAAPYLENKFNMQIWKMMDLRESPYYALQPDKAANEIAIVQELAFALFLLTRERKYNDFYELTISQGEIDPQEKRESFVQLFREVIELFIKKR